MLKFSEMFEFSKEKFRKIPILKEFEWFEWFEWFGPSPIEPFNSGVKSARSPRIDSPGVEYEGTALVLGGLLKNGLTVACRGDVRLFSRNIGYDFRRSPGTAEIQKILAKSVTFSLHPTSRSLAVFTLKL